MDTAVGVARRRIGVRLGAIMNLKRCSMAWRNETFSRTRDLSLFSQLREPRKEKPMKSKVKEPTDLELGDQRQAEEES